MVKAANATVSAVQDSLFELSKKTDNQQSQQSTARSGNEEGANFKKEIDRVDRKCAELELQSKSVYKDNSDKLVTLEGSVFGLKEVVDHLTKNKGVAPEFIEQQVGEMQH
mmetsp:Transcript_41838/g.63988  ORF Transcript_41838/g.63988 Transcript_41838/m.63988 type:complete len:110 (+) Transcript_41838:4428-4757(+)